MKKTRKIVAKSMTSLLLDGKIKLDKVTRLSRLNNGVHFYACAYRYYRHNPTGANPLDILCSDVATLPDCGTKYQLQSYLDASIEMSARGFYDKQEQIELD